jgi:hypothetical protein
VEKYNTRVNNITMRCDMELKYNRVKFRTMLVSFTALMLLVSLGTVFANPEPKITICHHTGSEQNPQATITINENAWPAHQAHGDSIGPCELPPPPVPELPTIALMGLGILGLLFMSKKKN